MKKYMLRISSYGLSGLAAFLLVWGSVSGLLACIDSTGEYQYLWLFVLVGVLVKLALDLICKPVHLGRLISLVFSCAAIGGSVYIFWRDFVAGAQRFYEAISLAAGNYEKTTSVENVLDAMTGGEPKFIYIVALTLGMLTISVLVHWQRRWVASLLAVPALLLPLAFGKCIPYVFMIVVAFGILLSFVNANLKSIKAMWSVLLIMIILGVAIGASYMMTTPNAYDEQSSQRWKDKDKLENRISDMMKVFSGNGFGEDVLQDRLNSDLNEDKIEHTDEVLAKVKMDLVTYNSFFKYTDNVYLIESTKDVYKDGEWASVQNNKDYQKSKVHLLNEGVSPDNLWSLYINYSSDVMGEVSYLSIYDVASNVAKRLSPYGMTRKEERDKDKSCRYSYYNYASEIAYTNYLQENEKQERLFNYTDIKAILNEISDLRQMGYDASYYNDIDEDNYDDNYFEYLEDGSDVCYLIDMAKNFAKLYDCRCPEELIPQLDEIVKALNTSTDSETTKIEKLKLYFRNSFQYTLSPGDVPSGIDPVIYFAQTNKKGYCSHFATLGTLLLRRMNLITRYAQGFKLNKNDFKPIKEGDYNYYVAEVKDSDAHAWTEVYDDVIGFVPVEFTPAAESGSQSPSSQQTSTPVPTATAAATTTPKTTPVVTQKSAVSSGTSVDSISTPKENVSSGFSIPSWLWYILLAIGCIIIGIIIRMINAERVRKRYQRKLFKRLNLNYEGESEVQYARHLWQELGLEDEKAFAFSHLLLKEHYAKETLTVEEENEKKRLLDIICNLAEKKVSFLWKLINQL